MATIIDGKYLSALERTQIQQQIVGYQNAGWQLQLAIILVGQSIPSLLYIQNKMKACAEVGIQVALHKFPETITQIEIIACIEKLNHDPQIHAILLQLPLPSQLSEFEILEYIHPDKDVDGLHSANTSALYQGNPRMIPCTPLACVALIKSVTQHLVGKHAVIVGRSNLVGKPLAQLLLLENCTVTQSHSQSGDLTKYTHEADLLVVAVGRPGLIQGNMVKMGSIVIDVGINRIDQKIVGDVDFTSVVSKAGYLTPVPGGVGPMTVTCLLQNVLTLFEKYHKH